MDEEMKKIVEMLRPVFEKMDTNHDGKLSVDEIKAHVKALEGDLPEEKYGEMVESCNPSGSDITFDQVVEKMPDLIVKIMLFDAADKNGDKRIDLPEFKFIIKIILGDIIEDSQLEEMFKGIDANNDGLITLPELLNMEA
eukprot:TRINITY_DN1841_c0_g1_i11.p3 TRINITY_DN1841_c0_g1~~TRINITY_DN1841_c0_g1_i11.p3  ORF type:complete len:140 (-),score=73.97 TRINITY_DN1841_c0_g1_i11:246-665(-)